MNTQTIFESLQNYIQSVRLARSQHTARAYQNGLSLYLETLAEHNVDGHRAAVSEISEDSIVWFATRLKDHAPTTERLYLTAATGYFEYLVAENLANLNLPRIRMLIRQRARRPGIRLPQFPADAIEHILEAMLAPINHALSGSDRLIELRDRAFLVTLADTGLRVHEACNLRRGDMDWTEGKAMIIGKGDRQDIIRFSTRSMRLLQEYLRARAIIDGGTRKPLTTLPLFARHDKGTGTKVQAITTITGRNIVTARVTIILGQEAVGTITPHSFRHYFVTRVLKRTNNLKLAQSLARHRNIAVTQRYAHLADSELDEGYSRAIED